MTGLTTTLRMKQIEKRQPIITTHTRVHLEQAAAVDAAKPMSSADTVKLWHQAYLQQQQENQQ